MAAPVSTAGDTAGSEAAFTGDTGQPAHSAEPTTATQGESIDEGSDAAAGESDLPFNEQEFDGAPDQWREKLNSVLGWGKSLEKDLKTLRSTSQAYQPLEQYGGVDAVMQQLQTLQGLGTYATNEHGQVQRDENGFPYLTTAPFLQGLQQQENGQLLTDQLAYDLWSQTRPDGQTYGQWYMSQLGLDLGRLDEYRAGVQSQVTSSSDTIADWETDTISGQFNDDRLTSAYKGLTPAERKTVQNLLYDDKVADAKQILAREAARMDNESRIAQIEQAQKAEQQHALESFWQGVSQQYVAEIGRTNREAIATLTNQISSQVTFSSDPSINQVQTGAVGALIAAFCSEQTRFAMEPVMQALGVQYDPQLDGLFSQHAEAMQNYLTLKAAAENPRFSSYRNDAEMNKAKATADALHQRALAKLAPVAAKIAKAIAGQNQEQRDQRNAALSAANGRPTIGNGAVGNNQRQVPKGVNPFSVEFLQQIS